MEILTKQEIKGLNNLSTYTRKMKFGRKIQTMITLMNQNSSNDFPEVGTPKNAVNASAKLEISGVTNNGETVTIGTDVYEFVVAAVLTLETNIPVDISAGATALESATALIAAITLSDTQGVAASAGAANSVIITFEVAGVAGNAITIESAMENGAFANAATTLLGGVNATIGNKNQSMIDSSYLYRCIADNTITDKNWRRIAVGSDF